jgi:hypothetical protein
MPKNKNKGNSPLYDSSYIQSRKNVFLDDKKTMFMAFLTHDSVDNLIIFITQLPSYRQHIEFGYGQKVLINFTDSTSFAFTIDNQFEARYDDGKYTTHSFRLPLTDSLKYILTHKTMSSIVVNNQGTSVNVRDRVFKSDFKTEIIFSRIFCCFEALKRKRGIK